MAVVPGQRGRGVGRQMLQGVIELAQRRGWSALSLSVEDGNSATKLYRAMGFVTVGRSGNSDTMLLDFRTNSD